ncbi:MAG: hypothetical protein H6988_10950 [Pseudomonadales bacterium]|nr:hypothetical protein [Pseudomonadales bacterium]
MMHLTISLSPDWKTALRAAGARARNGVGEGRYQGEFFNFETPGQFFGRLTERRWAIVRAMQGAGPMSQRELARRVGRDVKRVYEDVQALIVLGLIEKTDSGEIECPYDDIFVNMHLKAA